MDKHGYSAYCKDNVAYVDQPAKNFGSTLVNGALVIGFLLGLLQIIG